MFALGVIDRWLSKICRRNFLPFISLFAHFTTKQTKAVRITERDRMQFILFYSLRLMLLCMDEPIIDYGVMFNVHIVMSVWHVVYWQTLLTFPICNQKKSQLSKSQNEIKFCNTFVAVLRFASHCCTGNANCMDSSQRNCTEWRQSNGCITTILYVSLVKFLYFKRQQRVWNWSFIRTVTLIQPFNA